MTLEWIIVERRFLGPPTSANGGYICGRIARHIDGAAEVTLRHPPPLDTELELCTVDDGTVVLRHGDRDIASGVRLEDWSPADWPAVSTEEAAIAAARTFPADQHPFPTCFVCGPARSPGDGLRLQAGPLSANDPEWSGTLAVPWTADASLDDGAGRVRSEFVWAALDCPTAYASSSASGMRPMLLGRQSVRIERLPRVGETSVIVARATGHDGRKRFADAALFAADGTQLAGCRAIWIELAS